MQRDARNSVIAWTSVVAVAAIGWVVARSTLFDEPRPCEIEGRPMTASGIVSWASGYHGGSGLFIAKDQSPSRKLTDEELYLPSSAPNPVQFDPEFGSLEDLLAGQEEFQAYGTWSGTIGPPKSGCEDWSFLDHNGVFEIKSVLDVRTY